jgi:hypothetical protein
MKTQKNIARVRILLVGIIFFVFAISFSSAKCSIGASPLEMSASARTGQTVEVIWNLINLRGDRNTHVLISQTSGLDWEVEYIPVAGLKRYDIAGAEQEINSNFAIPVSEVVSEKPEPLPAGKLAYIVHPNVQEGYILVDKQQKILITIPDDAKIGETQEFVFTALGRCFGEVGTVTASVATELKVKITPTTEYYEREIDDVKKEFFGTQIFNYVIKPLKMEPVEAILTGTTLILLIVFVLLLLSSKRKKKKWKK